MHTRRKARIVLEKEKESHIHRNKLLIDELYTVYPDSGYRRNLEDEYLTYCTTSIPSSYSELIEEFRF